MTQAKWGEATEELFMHKDSKYRDPDKEMIFRYSRNRKGIFVAATCQEKGGESEMKLESKVKKWRSQEWIHFENIDKW